MTGSQDVGGFANHREEIPVLPAGEGIPETGLSAGEDRQAAGREFLPTEGGSLPYWPVPQMDEEKAFRQVLVVSVQVAPVVHESHRNPVSYEEKSSWLRQNRSKIYGKTQFLRSKNSVTYTKTGLSYVPTICEV